jgi:hypothetical protein
MIVLLEHDALLGLQRVRLRDRLRARLRAAELDNALAAGASPESDVALALHAGRLCRPGQRQLVARGLTRVAAAAGAPTPRRNTVPVCRPAVQRARDDLQAVLDRLDAGPVDVRGVARIRTLLADGTGPLYRQSAPDRLRHDLRAALAAMDPFV